MINLPSSLTGQGNQSSQPSGQSSGNYINLPSSLLGQSPQSSQPTSSQPTDEPHQAVGPYAPVPGSPAATATGWQTWQGMKIPASIPTKNLIAYDTNTGIKTFKLPSGGVYSQDKNNNIVVGQHTTYGGVPASKGNERDDIIPVSLGGVNSNPQNIKLVPNSKASQQDKIETSLAGQVKSGQIMSKAGISQALREKSDIANTPGLDVGSPNFNSNIFDNSIAQAQHLALDPLSLKANPTKAIGDAWNALKGSVDAYNKANKDVFTAVSKGTLPQAIGAELHGVSSAANVIFSPISALFAAANDVPVLGTVSKLITLPFSIVGEGATGASNKIVNSLPISQKAKDQIKPGLGEIASLAAQLALGKVTEVGAEKMSELTKKFGPNDAQTIVKEAQKVAETKQALEENKPTTPQIQPLAQEARKYKSAEEFVKAQPKLYHSGTADIKEVNPSKGNFSKTFYLSDNADYAKSFGGPKASLNEMTLDPKANIIDLRKPTDEQIQTIKNGIDTLKAKPAKYGEGFSFYPYSEKDVIQGIRDGKAHFAELPQIKEVLKNLGYDGQITAEVPYAKNIGVWNKDVIKTKSQLTDLYNQATKGTPPETPPTKIEPTTVKVSRSQLPVGEGETKVSALAARMKENLTNLSEEDKANLPNYETSNNTDQLKKGLEFAQKDPEVAMEVLKGNKPAPKGVLVNAIYLGLKELGKGDPQLATDLASLHSTRYGQEIQILSKADPYSPDTYIKEINDAYTKIEPKAREASTRTEMKKATDVLEKAKSAPKPKTNWNDFLDSIQC